MSPTGSNTLPYTLVPERSSPYTFKDHHSVLTLPTKTKALKGTVGTYPHFHGCGHQSAPNEVISLLFSPDFVVSGLSLMSAKIFKLI